MPDATMTQDPSLRRTRVDGSAVVRCALRRVSGRPDEIRALQRVLDASPRYARIATGLPPGPADARSLWVALPERKSHDDKFVFGIHDGDTMIGCIDLIRGYPDDHTAHIGLLLVDEAHAGRGVGRAAFDALEALVRDWRTCSRIRLGVIRTNVRAMAFWTRLGFQATGEVTPYRQAAVTSEVVMLDKTLCTSPR